MGGKETEVFPVRVDSVNAELAVGVGEAEGEAGLEPAGAAAVSAQGGQMPDGSVSSGSVVGWGSGPDTASGPVWGLYLRLNI